MVKPMAKPMGKILEVRRHSKGKEGCERDFVVLLEPFTSKHGVIRAVHGESDVERGRGSKSLPPSFLSSARPKWRARLLLPNTAISASPD